MLLGDGDEAVPAALGVGRERKEGEADALPRQHAGDRGGGLQRAIRQMQRELDEVAVVGEVDNGDEEAVAGDVDGGAAAGTQFVDEVDAQRLTVATAASLIGHRVLGPRTHRATRRLTEAGCARGILATTAADQMVGCRCQRRRPCGVAPGH